MTDVLLKASGLKVRFGETEIVHGIDFEIRRGECLALVGESGSGKSVSAHAILGLLPKKAVVQGKVSFEDIDLVSATAAVLQGVRGNRIAMIFQEPMTSLNPLHTIERQVGEALILHRQFSAQQRRQRVIELLSDVGIRDPESRLGAYPHQLSGGQRQRVMIAMALACDPELLIADEPTTALDVVVQSRIIDLLKEIQERRGMALLIISHDLNVVRRVATRIAVMRQGNIVETGDCATVFSQPAHPYTRMLIDAEPDGEPADHVSDRAPLLELRDVSVAYERKTGFWARKAKVVALQDASLTLKPGRTLGVVGESGSGKSTLGQAVLRLIKSEGAIIFNGQRLDTMTPKQLRGVRRHFQIVFQDPFGSLSPHMSVGQIIAEGLREHGNLPETAVEAEVIEALRDVQLDPDSRHRFAHEFSGGQRQRIAIARALVLRPELIVLDEPTSALDRTVQKQVVELLRNLQERFGIAYLFVSHDLAVVRALAHDVMVLKSGRVVEYGSAKEVLSAPSDPYTQTLLAASSLGAMSEDGSQHRRRATELNSAKVVSITRQ